MKPSALRAFMRRHGNAGVLAVSAYLGLRHLWSHHRAATILTACGVMSLGAASLALLKPHSRAVVKTPVPPIVLEQPSHPIMLEQRPHPVTQPVLPHGRPLFSRVTKLFRAEAAWSWGGWDHAEYRWLSDSEIFYAEAYSTGNRIEPAHLYRYNVLSGRKTHLKRLEGLVDCFYHSQMEISPDGKWLLWHGGDGDKETVDVATLNGRHHRQWPCEFDTEPLLGWMQDSRHWIEFNHNADPVLHNINRKADNHKFPLPEGSVSHNDDVLGEHIVFIDDINERETTPTIHVQVTSVPPHTRRVLDKQINIPKNLPNPNIVGVEVSPDAKRIALIVGYGDGPVPRETAKDSVRQSSPPVSPLYHPNSVFGPTRRNAQMRAYCLLICNIDGSKMHEVGTWQEETNPNVVLELENLRWLPSGKRLSFFCNNVFYTVPAD